ncbi:MAG: glycosyltransferase family protein [Candidatus Pacearchaeota archaeon]
MTSPRKKLLHIMMGQHNPDLKNGLSQIFDCIHLDWIIYRSNTDQLQKDILKKVNEFSPDVVFMHLQREGVVTIETVTSIRKQGIVVFSWTGDVRYPVPQHYLTLGKHIDATLFSNMNDVEFCNNNGIVADFLQVGYDEYNFSPIGYKDENYPEIVFMGSNYPSINFPLTKLRSEMVTRLKSEFGNRFGLYGGGWGKLADGSINSYKEEGNVYRSCKIAINLSHFAYKRYSSDRLFRILGCGTFCLSHHYPDMEVDFNVGNDLVVWNDIDDLVEKIKMYLQNNLERKRIANNGYNNVINNFTWINFAEGINKLTDKYSHKMETKKEDWVNGIKNVNISVKKYAQFGEEAIFDYIFSNIGETNKFLVDFGASSLNLGLSNSKYLLEKGWNGLLMDGNSDGNPLIKEEFITAENICSLFKKYSVPNEFDLLSIDIDGNDIWVLESILNGGYKPRVIINEFNGCIPVGVNKAIKYNPTHTWGENDYYGGSFEAFKVLLKKFGYTLVHQIETTNMIFVRSDIVPEFDYGVTYERNQYHAHSPNREWVEYK